jgi:hypothetical protein
MTAPLVINRRPTLVVSSRGSEIPGVLLEDCSWHYGYDKRVAEASFLLERVPSWLDFWAPITLAAGATDATTEVRFSGYLYDFPRFGFGPRKHAVDCRGPLIKADTALVQDEAADPDVPGMDLSGFTAAAQTVERVSCWARKPRPKGRARTTPTCGSGTNPASPSSRSAMR